MKVHAGCDEGEGHEGYEGEWIEWYVPAAEYMYRVSIIKRRGLPCTVYTSNRGGRLCLELQPGVNWVHLSNEIGLAEAPFPYHISLCCGIPDDDPQLQAMRLKWHGVDHTLSIERVSAKAVAMVSDSDACATCPLIRGFHGLGWHNQLSVSM